MDIFEYEYARRTKTRSIFGSAGDTILILVIFLSWLIVGGLFVKAAIRQTPGFQFHDASFGVKMAALSSLEKQDLVLIGSSRVHRQFDVQAIERSCGVKALNLGIGGGTSSNTKFMLDWILDQPNQPDKIWIEPLGADSYRQITTDRSLLYAPVWPGRVWQERFGEQAVKAEGSPLAASLAIWRTSLKSYFSVGTFWAVREETLPPEQLVDLYKEMLARKGFDPLDDVLSEQHSRRRKLAQILKDQPDYFENQLSAPSREYASLSQPELNQRVLIDLWPMIADLKKDELRKIGVVYPPKLAESQLPVSSVSFRGVEIPVITFPISQNAYLADPEWWIDEGHLKREGAEKLSKSFAEQVCGGSIAVH
ncbi:hypothetical protein [Hyphomonas jannaschiana]|uniref:Uncharacterized protein n=1 Tax=Hyphomonas jannaschiana VP2 TaxID=1280952 RepID=A0A059FFA3_9PROT|nr:hypothetical protein [Hyphomonas jannaschiana]KCZ89282.1 hypothetical protein HJA_08292 [Hyphomonas jannaschiana VP2]